MDDIALRLSALKQAWQSLENIPDDLTLLGLPGKNGQFVEDAIHELACIAAELTSAPGESLVMIRSSCEAHLKQLEAFFFQDISDNPSMQMLAFVTLLMEMQSSLREAVLQEHPELAGRFRGFKP
ncbi:MAG: hypothetical protein R8L58_01240 [Mariprofundaceae bacterium]